MTKHKAFSFLELSLVILIMGLLIAAIASGVDLVNDAKLSHARALTQNSPVNTIPGLALWLDTTSERSFSEAESEEGKTVSKWNDISSEASASSYLSNDSATASDLPVYKERCIDGLPCLYFNGTAGSTLTSPRSLGISTKYISLFFVFTGSENTTSTYSSQIFDSSLDESWAAGVGKFAFTTTQPSMYFYYKLSNSSSYGIQGTRCETNAILQSKEKYIYSLIDDYTSPISHYINGGLASNSGTGNDGEMLKSLGKVGVGTASFQGNIGEIIIFTKALSDADRKSVEKYLSQKWGIPVGP